MKILVATSETQVDQPGDYSFVPDGQLLARYGTVCDCPDCGCGRGFPGVFTHKATTTAMVAESDMSEGEWRTAVHTCLHETGWAKGLTAGELAELIDDLVEIDVHSITDLPVGTIVERYPGSRPCGCKSDELRVRRLPLAHPA